MSHFYWFCSCYLKFLTQIWWVCFSGLTSKCVGPGFGNKILLMPNSEYGKCHLRIKNMKEDGSK